ncbi:flagellar biosynthetic protein FliP [Solimonas sp. K1W22B-7]|uniref:flagellar type III secretion system pore protein FliP n=1 Tax=Solimonas sp. K1W22B-7 TaxID=2303331 RepID=UPI000E3356EB|nr:flagellar type III secretion system pore protein FliP [Solimonas sp. K1W22B-7]AXQ28069.1 flagellar biosynthetic protein FliP [Solimonas sp. K1W22B-7]
MRFRTPGIRWLRLGLPLAGLLALLVLPGLAVAADITFPGGSLDFASQSGKPLSTPLRLVLMLTVLSLVPSLLIVLTSFTRIIVVLAMLRHALGMPETPPNAVLISLALFLTVFTMLPVWEQVDQQALTPYMNGAIAEKELLEKGSGPVREFMLAQTREKDLALMIELSGAKAPVQLAEVKLLQLIPAFMISELRKAFEIGFIIFLPFVVIDIIVASVLMSLGMIMVPPLAFSLPLKILLFVLIDGWGLLSAALIRSFAPI